MTSATSPVIFYHPDAYRVVRDDLKGRHSAGESFLTSFLAQVSGPDVYGLCPGKDAARAFEDDVKAAGRPLTPHAFGRGDAGRLRAQSLLHLPFPGIAAEAGTRNFLGDDSYAISGVTHTIASREVISGVADIPVAPVMPWDALICTSRCVHEALSRVLDLAEESLRQRLGATRFTRPMMPIIPLGVHGKRFEHSAAERATWRKKLGIAEGTTVLLFFGRLSVHAKASPFQLAQAAEAAATQTKKPFAIIWCGWFNDDFQRRVFMDTAKSLAPSVAFHHVDGRKEAQFTIWSAADIFVSLSDNIQESFGLTIIEAMAAGLPVVASNWDGYREAIEHGVNGILIESYLPRVSMGDAAYRYAAGIDTYDLYIAALSQVCFVDMNQLVEWIIRLAGDETLRRKLGTAAAALARNDFDWASVMTRYFDMWREQAAQIVAARAAAETRPAAWKIYDPSVTFSGFPSQRIENATRLAAGAHFQVWDELLKKPGIVINSAVLAGQPALQALRQTLAGGQEQTVEALLSSFTSGEKPVVLRTLHWLIKVGLLRLVP